MSEIRSWNDTPAGLLANQGLVIEEAFAARAREFNSSERRAARAEYQAAVDADPQWKAARALQRELAERGWTGEVINVSTSVPPELQALHTARTAERLAMRVDAPGNAPQYMGDAEAQEIMREGARIRAERQAMIAKMMGPLDKTVAP